MKNILKGLIILALLFPVFSTQTNAATWTSSFTSNSMDAYCKPGGDWGVEPTWSHCFKRQLYIEIGSFLSGVSNINDPINVAAIRNIANNITSTYNPPEAGNGFALLSGNTLTVGCANGNQISFTIAAPSAPSCGTAKGGTYTSAPTSGLCSVGTATYVFSSNDGLKWVWYCNNPGFTSTADVECTANKGGTPTPPSSGTPSSGGGDTGTPIIGDPYQRSSTINCGTYISSWTENWGNCIFSSVAGNNVVCSQTSSYTAVSSNYSGTQTSTYQLVDGVETLVSGSNDCSSVKPADAIKPNPKTEQKSLTMSGTTSYPTTGQPYANNNDTLTLNIKLIGNTNQNKPITGLPSVDLSNFSSNMRSDIVSGIGAEALSMTSSATTTSIVPNTGTAFTFTIKSVTPLSTDKGEINFRLGNSPVKLTNVTLGFRKPFLGELEIRNPFAETGSTNEWNGTIQIGSIDDYRLWLTKTGSINMTLSSEIVVEEGDGVSFLTKVLAWEQGTDKLQIDEKSLTNTGSLRYTHTVTSPIIKFYIPFKARLNTSPQAEKMPEYPGIKVDKATISYTLGGKAVKYYISSEDPVGDTVGADSKVNVTANPPRPVTKQNSADFLGVRVIGGIQGGGNSEFTGQQQNISSIAPMNTRTAIRRNATLYITNMTSGQTVNGVKFVDLTKEANKNYPINGELAYETLIVKNGNVLINGKLNPDKKVLGIIVLKDAFNVTKDYNNVGNVYVTPNVSQINAIIYADGGFISVDNSGNPFEADSTARTQALKNQLLLNGSLFTRNTIGGAVPSIQTNGQYTLPGGAGTPYINIAIQYDLNYTRRGNVNCALAGGTKVEGGQTVCVYREPFIIRYDSRVQTTPPRLFAQ